MNIDRPKNPEKQSQLNKERKAPAKKMVRDQRAEMKRETEVSHNINRSKTKRAR